MKRILLLIITVLAWFAVLTQLVLMIQNRVADMGETIIRFFSFFTILTNLLVAVYFLYQLLKTNPARNSIFNHRSFLTAVTVYITLVGLVYQIALRNTWHPTGMQMIVDELLHSVIPVLVIIYWIKVQDKTQLFWKDLPRFLLYPTLYLSFILLRGQFSGFYPYPFVNVTEIGWTNILINVVVLCCTILVISSLFIGLGKAVVKK